MQDLLNKTAPHPSLDLARLFASVETALMNNREALNQADPYNGNHGDHMVEIFHVASQAAQEMRGQPVEEAMDYAGAALRNRPENATAGVYARGLTELAAQLRKYHVTEEELFTSMSSALANEEGSGLGAERSGEVLKALLAGLAGWQQGEAGAADSGSRLDMGALFGLGMAYLQAKQRGGTRSQVLADAAASASPLSGVPHRYLSGKIALQALLDALGGAGSNG